MNNNQHIPSPLECVPNDEEDCDPEKDSEYTPNFDAIFSNAPPANHLPNVPTAAPTCYPPTRPRGRPPLHGQPNKQNFSPNMMNSPQNQNRFVRVEHRPQINSYQLTPVQTLNIPNQQPYHQSNSALLNQLLEHSNCSDRIPQQAHQPSQPYNQGPNIQYSSFSPTVTSQYQTTPPPPVMPQISYSDIETHVNSCCNSTNTAPTLTAPLQRAPNHYIAPRPIFHQRFRCSTTPARPREEFESTMIRRQPPGITQPSSNMYPATPVSPLNRPRLEFIPQNNQRQQQVQTQIDMNTIIASSVPSRPIPDKLPRDPQQQQVGLMHHNSNMSSAPPVSVSSTTRMTVPSVDNIENLRRSVDTANKACQVKITRVEQVSVGLTVAPELIEMECQTDFEDKEKPPVKQYVDRASSPINIPCQVRLKHTPKRRKVVQSESDSDTDIDVIE